MKKDKYTDRAVTLYKKFKGDLKLTPHYFTVFEYRYGLTDGEMHSYAATGKAFGVSGTRINQLIARVMYETEKLEYTSGRQFVENEN